jgi:cyclic beta-1,2-glucan synthetase
MRLPLRRQSAEATWEGLNCTLELLFEAVRALQTPEQSAVDKCEAEIQRVLGHATGAAADWYTSLKAVTDTHWPILDRAVGACIAASPDATERRLAEVHVWLERVHHHIRALSREVESMLPWLEAAAGAPEGMETIAKELLCRSCRPRCR